MKRWRSCNGSNAASSGVRNAITDALKSRYPANAGTVKRPGHEALTLDGGWSAASVLRRPSRYLRLPEGSCVTVVNSRGFSPRYCATVLVLIRFTVWV
jgi:hypothetical protein